MSSQDSKPLLSLKQDSMTGGYKLTFGRVKIPKHVFFDCLTSEYLNLKNSVEKFDHIIKVYKHLGLYDEEKQKILKQYPECEDIDQLVYDEIIFNGHSLFSMLLPNDFEYEIHNKLSPDKKNVVVIRGVLISGTLNKGAIGSSSGSLIHHIAKDYDYQVASDFVTNYQILICDWLIHHGFTISLSDCITYNSDVVDEEMNKCFLKTVAPLKNEKDEKMLEGKVINILNKTTEIGQKLSKQALDPDNNIVAVITSGAKGNEFNITQITGAVGQQNISGERVPKTFGGRTLPHYKKFSQLLNYTERLPEELLRDESVDLIPHLRKMFESRGFVSNSYYKGLNPQEFFFHCAGGREGVIDTAVKSVSWETEILIGFCPTAKVVKIGEWIDQEMNKCRENVIMSKREELGEIINFELLKLNSPVKIVSCDEKGKVSWSELTHVTRHDPGKELFEITTQSFRKVIVTAAQSLIVYDEKEESFIPRFTKDVKIGDKLPVTMNTPCPDEVCEYVDMTRYFPKTEYIYGTDFQKAVKLMNEIMESDLTDGAIRHLAHKGINTNNMKRQKTPAGWWNKVNGKDFILPYPSKARLQRVMIRSKVENVKEGYIYPYDAKRNDVQFSDKFELSEENGIFIGLFIADGYVDSEKSVKITKNELSVREFIENFFNKIGIKHRTEVKKTTSSISTTVIGYSVLLGRFLNSLVGQSSYKKHIPNEAFTAPSNFIKGLINGYFSGDGSIHDNSLDCCSVSEDLIDGIQMLLTRFGIFGKKTVYLGNDVPSYKLIINSFWAMKFKETFTLVHKEKNRKLLELYNSRTTHINFPTQNDYVLDEIVSIKPVNPKDHRYMYDVTVPSTWNFQLANGLLQNDTATTGYIQRRITKMMEDLKINYLGSVETSTNRIIQFSYGGDGLAADKLIATKHGYSLLDIDHVVDKLNKDVETN